MPPCALINSTMPFTVSREVGSVVPIPILPLSSSVMLASPKDFVLVNLAIRPGVLPP